MKKVYRKTEIQQPDDLSNPVLCRLIANWLQNHCRLSARSIYPLQESSAIP